MPSQLLEKMALAHQILVNEGVLDGFGHISARHPINNEGSLIARSMSPDLRAGTTWAKLWITSPV